MESNRQERDSASSKNFPLAVTILPPLEGPVEGSIEYTIGAAAKRNLCVKRVVGGRVPVPDLTERVFIPGSCFGEIQVDMRVETLIAATAVSPKWQYTPVRKSSSEVMIETTSPPAESAIDGWTEMTNPCALALVSVATTSVTSLKENFTEDSEHVVLSRQTESKMSPAAWAGLMQAILSLLTRLPETRLSPKAHATAKPSDMKTPNTVTKVPPATPPFGGSALVTVGRRTDT
jgi:hypothetical protein